MAKLEATTVAGGAANSLDYANGNGLRRPGLFVPRVLADLPTQLVLDPAARTQAEGILLRWADLESAGKLRKKEVSLDADFLNEVFGEALGHRVATTSSASYNLERQFAIPGIGAADGALGQFAAGQPPRVAAVIELKGAATDLDRDRANGRTAVRQLWDYLNHLPDCPWGILSNFREIRLYHRSASPRVFHRYYLQELRNPQKFKAFYRLFSLGGFVPSHPGERPRADALLERSVLRRGEVGAELYEQYSKHRVQLIAHLHRKLGRPLETAIAAAQKLIDRIVFIAYCEGRGLLPDNLIKDTYGTIPPLTRARNPRWRNFVELFHAVDQGVPDNPLLANGYNGGLFRRDPEVDDLQLDDEWTRFFSQVAGYDFCDEVNVEALGHLFEQSIDELERFRAGELFEALKSASAMPKSAERKRGGVYYTPAALTKLIVTRTVGAAAGECLEAACQAQGLDRGAADELPEPDPRGAAAARSAAAGLRQLSVMDPACGSGAFLIAAYDELEDRYSWCVEMLRRHASRGESEALSADFPDFIVNENLFGVDLSPQAVEIAQLALWLRSARLGRTLADLSANVVHGNSLVTDPAAEPHAIADWRERFPAPFARPAGGFDCVIGNPPWERLKLQEREYFSYRAPAIAQAVNAAERRKLLAKWEKDEPDAFARFAETVEAAQRTLDHLRASGRFPLTGKGDINAYAVFAELAGQLVAPTGRVGMLVPSGIATDHTTKEFFGDLTSRGVLDALFDFENKKGLFPDVDGRFKFTALFFGGPTRKTKEADFVFFAHDVEELDDKKRHIRLSAKDIALVNPNTRTCPVFRSRKDAEITKGIYRRVPVLWDRSRQQGGNPWGVRFQRMFDQTNDAELFQDAAALTKLGLKPAGNRWTGKGKTYLPLYEAKMIQAYDHRAACVKVVAENWVRQGQTEETSLVQHQNPEFSPCPRWWVEVSAVNKTLDGQPEAAVLGFKDITSPTNQRTMIAALIPHAAVTNHFPLLRTGAAPRLKACLLANLNSAALDFVSRQKIGGVTLNFFIVEQLPVLPPERYAERAPWQKRGTLEKWVSDRVLKLTCTANDLAEFAAAAGFESSVHPWREDDRAKLRAELDAAYLLLYGLDRGDAEHVLATFPSVDAAPILEEFERLRSAGAR